jgi:hypothetical protein
VTASRPARISRAVVARIYRANLAGSFSDRWTFGYLERGVNRREASIAIAPDYRYPGLVPATDMGRSPVRILRAVRSVRS